MLDYKNLPVNTILHTRDGRKIGNAIVQSASPIKKHLYHIITDLGEMSIISVGEMIELFHKPVGFATHTHKYFTIKGRQR